MRPGLKIALIAMGLAISPIAANAEIGITLIADGFDQPVFVASPAGDDRLFVVDQPGRILIIDGGAVLAEPFLDIRPLVGFGGERGLLGLAFHPDYPSNGRFFLNYTERGGGTRIVEYRVSSDPNRADPDSSRLILGFAQPASNHNGGWIGFGPDGYLYIATGDGGASNDSFGNGQNPNSLLAKILRLDIDNGDPYAIPACNPWVGGGGAPEAFAYGLRNPWRAAFDGEDLYIADVGQNQWEEISVITTADAGANLGWSIMEGNNCFQANSCEAAGLVVPAYQYSHGEGCSVTGGYVYRGAAIPELIGQYVFADYCTGFVRSFRYSDGAAGNVNSWSAEIGDVGRVTSFGVDDAGELYITAVDGRVFKIVPQ